MTTQEMSLNLTSSLSSTPRVRKACSGVRPEVLAWLESTRLSLSWASASERLSVKTSGPAAPDSEGSSVKTAGPAAPNSAKDQHPLSTRVTTVFGSPFSIDMWHLH